MAALHTDVLTVLRRVHTRLAPAGAWRQGCFAGTRGGDACGIWAPDASCWCIEGALMAETHDRCSLVHAGAEAALVATLGLRGSGLTLAGWNDAPGRQHSDVVRVLDLTIARLTRERGEAA